MTATPRTAGPGDAGRFAAASAVVRQGAGQYLADLDADLSVAGRLNGGYLLAVLVRAALTELGSEPEPAEPADGREVSGAPVVGDGEQPAGDVRPNQLPVASTAHYLTAADPGPAQVTVEVLRRGSRTGQVRARLHQDGAGRVEALITVAAPRAGEAWADAPPVELPPEQDCFLMPPQAPGAPFATPIMAVVEERLDPACLAFAFGQPTGAGQLRGWLRIPGNPAVDAAGLILAADALPPAAFDLGRRGWMPTLSLTVHLTGLPVPGPLRIRQQVRGLESGVLTQTCDIWDDAGRLVAHAVQLAALPPDRSRR